MSTTSQDEAALRHRLSTKPAAPLKVEDADSAQKIVTDLNEDEKKALKHDTKTRTYGRTPGGEGMVYQ